MYRSIPPDEKTARQVLSSMNRFQNTDTDTGAKSQLLVFPQETTSVKTNVVRHTIPPFSRGKVLPYTDSDDDKKLMSDLDIIKSVDSPYKHKLIKYHDLHDSKKELLIREKNIKYHNTKYSGEIPNLMMTQDFFFNEIGLITHEQQKNFILGFDEQSNYDTKNKEFTRYMSHLIPYNDIQNQDLKKLIFDLYFTIIIIQKFDLIPITNRQIIIHFFLLSESEKPKNSVGSYKYSSLFCGNYSLLNKIKDISLKKVIKMHIFNHVNENIKPLLTTDKIAKLTINRMDYDTEINNIIFNDILYNCRYNNTFESRTTANFYGILRNTKEVGIEKLNKKNLNPKLTEVEIKEFTDEIELIHGGKKIKLPRKQNIFIKQKKSRIKRSQRKGKRSINKRKRKQSINKKRSRKRY